MKQNKNTKHNFFENLAAKVTTATRSTPAILIAFNAVIIWAIAGLVFKG